MVLKRIINRPLPRGIHLQYDQIHQYAKRLVKEFDVRTPDITHRHGLFPVGTSRKGLSPGRWIGIRTC